MSSKHHTPDSQHDEVLQVLRVVLRDQSTLYERLGVTTDATPEQVKSAYKRRCLLLHPDKCSHARAKDAFQRVQEAYATLSDANQRERYDLQRQNPFWNASASASPGAYGSPHFQQGPQFSYQRRGRGGGMSADEDVFFRQFSAGGMPLDLEQLLRMMARQQQQQQQQRQRQQRAHAGQWDEREFRRGPAEGQRAWAGSAGLLSLLLLLGLLLALLLAADAPSPASAHRWSWQPQRGLTIARRTRVLGVPYYVSDQTARVLAAYPAAARAHDVDVEQAHVQELRRQCELEITQGTSARPESSCNKYAQARDTLAAAA